MTLAINFKLNRIDLYHLKGNVVCRLIDVSSELKILFVQLNLGYYRPDFLCGNFGRLKVERKLDISGFVWRYCISIVPIVFVNSKLSSISNTSEFTTTNDATVTTSWEVLKPHPRTRRMYLWDFLLPVPYFPLLGQ